MFFGEGICLLKSYDKGENFELLKVSKKQFFKERCVKKCKLKIIDRKEAAERLGMTPQALSCHVSRRNWSAIPIPVKIGGRWKWVEEVLEEWVLDRVDEAAAMSGRSKRRGPGRPSKIRSTSCS